MPVAPNVIPKQKLLGSVNRERIERGYHVMGKCTNVATHHFVCMFHAVQKTFLPLIFSSLSCSSTGSAISGDHCQSADLPWAV